MGVPNILKLLKINFPKKGIPWKWKRFPEFQATVPLFMFIIIFERAGHGWNHSWTPLAEPNRLPTKSKALKTFPHPVLSTLLWSYEWRSGTPPTICCSFEQSQGNLVILKIFLPTPYLIVSYLNNLEMCMTYECPNLTRLT